MVLYSEGRIINSYAEEPAASELHPEDPTIKCLIQDFLSQYCRKSEADLHSEKKIFSIPSRYKHELLYILNMFFDPKAQRQRLIPDFLKRFSELPEITPADILVLDKSECAWSPVLPYLQSGLNELEGYCRENLQIADMERQLSEKKVYEDFKKCFSEVCDLPWNIARNEFPFGAEEIIYALRKIGFMEEAEARTFVFRASCGWDTPVTKEVFLSHLQSRNGRRFICIMDSGGEVSTKKLSSELNELSSMLLWPIILSE